MGYGFGQLFALGHFTFVPTLGGSAALLAAAVGAVCRARRSCCVAVTALCTIAGVCVVIEAIDYTVHYSGGGNDFGWALRLPFLASLALLGAYAAANGALFDRPSKPKD